MQTTQPQSFSPCNFYEEDYFCTCWKGKKYIYPVWFGSIKNASNLFYKLLYAHKKAQLWQFPRDGRAPILLGGKPW